MFQATIHKSPIPSSTPWCHLDGTVGTVGPRTVIRIQRSGGGPPHTVVRRRPPAYGASAVVRDCDRNRRGCGVQSDGERSLRFLVSNAKPQVLRSMLQERKGRGYLENYGRLSASFTLNHKKGKMMDATKNKRSNGGSTKSLSKSLFNSIIFDRR